jgi:nicotinate-nucleotide adenylyltransferase
VGLLGGSFNPPHLGHVFISEYIFRRLKLDAVWWLVTEQNPFKPFYEQTVEQRLEACFALCREHPFIAPIALDGVLGSSRTYDIVTFLKQQALGVHFVWMMGTDLLAEAHTWYRWEELTHQIPLIIKTRPGSVRNVLSTPALQKLASFRVAEEDAPALFSRNLPAWVLLHGPVSSVSSTRIRKKRF